MRYTMPSLALLLVVFGTACHCSKDASSTAGTPAPPANEATVAVVVPVPPVAPSTTVAVEEPVANQIEKSMGDSVYFSMQRTPCFGTCPSYTLIILEDGTAYYEGGRFAPREGSYTGKVSAETMEKLWELAETADFFSMQGQIRQQRYGPAQHDHPRSCERERQARTRPPRNPADLQEFCRVGGRTACPYGVDACLTARTSRTFSVAPK
jgi:hypothetical protein